MLNIFDWVRRCRTGNDLLALLSLNEEAPGLFDPSAEIAPPISADSAPCSRCGIYPPLAASAEGRCRACTAISARTRILGTVSRKVSVAWGFVNAVPPAMIRREGFYRDRVFGILVPDDRHFLMVLNRRTVKEWLQEMMLYYGRDIRGLVQLFPTTGNTHHQCMGDLIARAGHYEARFPPDLFRIRFFSKPHQMFYPHRRDDEGILTFEASEFIRRLEMAKIFRSLLNPQAQEMLNELIKLKEPGEEQFYWGRFMGFLSPKARDMLESWKIRQWNAAQIRLIYELRDYVVYTN